MGAALARANAGIVSHHPDTRACDGEDVVAWVELLCDGLTFDLIGLAPGRSLGPLVPAQTLGVSKEQLADCEVVGLAPGPHLAGAANTLPVVRTMVRLAAALLAPELHGVAALWRPADLATDVGHFVPAILNWLAGGPFPAPLMVRMTEHEGGVETRGLEFFLGRELRVDPDWKKGADAARLITRMVDRVIASGGPQGDEIITLVDGTQVVVTAQPGKIMLVPG